MSATRAIEIEGALNSVYFATRHLDQAASATTLIDAPPAVAEKLALARMHASQALELLAAHLRHESGECPLFDDAVPF